MDAGLRLAGHPGTVVRGAEMKGQMRELYRSALVVTPKQPFLEGLQSVDPTSSELTLHDLGREPRIHLIPECESDEDFEGYLRRMFSVIFEDQLEGWWTDESAWPGTRTFDTFQEWFDCRFHSIVIDLCDEPPIGKRL